MSHISGISSKVAPIQLSEGAGQDPGCIQNSAVTSRLKLLCHISLVSSELCRNAGPLELLMKSACKTLNRC